MRFQEITFRCFGPFEEKRLDFSAGNLHIVVGANEAGKSSALRGIYAFLFGFGHTTEDDYRFKTTQFRIQAELHSAGGESLSCVRRKGKKATLMSPDEKTEIAEADLSRFLGGLSVSQFEQLFGLDCELLRQGGELIAAGEGDLGEALFAAGAGLAGLRKLAEAITQRQGELYKSRSPAGRSQLPLNRALGEYKEALEATRHHTLPPEQHSAALATAAALETRASELREERALVRRELGELERFQLALPTIGMLLAARQRFAAVASAPHLPPLFGDKVRQALQQKHRAADKLKDLTAAREELERTQATAAPPENLLAEEAEIDELKGLIAADWNAREEELQIDARRKQALGEARDIYRDLTGTTDWILMDLLKPRDEEVNRLQDLASDAKAVALDVETAERQVTATREALTEAKGRQAELPDQTDPAPLSALIDTLAALGPLEEKERDLRHKLAADERRLRLEFGRLQPPAPGPWQAAPAVALPSSETVAEFRQRFEKDQRAHDKLLDERHQLDRDRAALEQQQAAASSAAGPFPSVADLSATRGARDHGLQLLRRRLSNEPDGTAEKAFLDQQATSRPLFDTTEQLVRQADTIADRLRSDADQIARQQTVEQNLRAWQNREHTWQTAQQVAAAAHTELQREWEQLWSGAGFAPQSPAVMESWLARWQRLCEQLLTWQEGERSLQQLQQQITAARERLTAVCPVAGSANSLDEGLRRARQIVQEAVSQQTAMARVKDDIRRLNSQLSAAETEWQQARARQEKWKKDWAAAIQPLGLSDANTSVATAQAYLKRITSMQDHLTEFRIKKKRLEELKAARDALLRRWDALQHRLQPGSKPATLDTLRDDFHQVESQLKTARVERTRYQERLALVQRNTAEQHAATEQLRLAEAELRALANEAGVDDPEELSSALQRAQERDAVERELRGHEQVLFGYARERSLDDFIQAALAARGSLEADIATRTTRANQLDPEIKAAEDEAREAVRILKGYEQAASAAAEARQQTEFLVTRLQEYVTEFAALQLAGVVLEQAKERYRALHQDTMLARAGEFFRLLTGDKFASIEIDNLEGKDVLTAVRPAGHVLPRVSVGGLSEGTRDQLFLALRLAGIDQHLQNREPLPLIMDDVLMTFDDGRSRATLRCLSQLAERTQVILFTHHQHLADFAREVAQATVVHAL